MGWGLGPKVVHWLYVAIVRPTISFASLVWWPGCQSASIKNKLSKVQRLACLGIMGALHSYWCYGGACWPSSAGSGDTGRGEVGGTLPLKLGGVGLTFTPNEDIVAYWHDFRSWTPFLI
jgi:hypothetical protein